MRAARQRGLAATGSGDPVQRGGGQVRAPGVHAMPVGQDLTAVFEEHDAVAEQAPALLRMAGDDMRGVPVGTFGVGAMRLVSAFATSDRMDRGGYGRGSERNRADFSLLRPKSLMVPVFCLSGCGLAHTYLGSL